MLRHADFVDIELHCVARFCHVDEEGPVSELYTDGSPPEDSADDNEPRVDEGMDPVVAVPTTTGDLAEDIQNLRALGFSIDDDNEPAEENLPSPSPQPNDEVVKIIYQTWDSKAVCNRKSDGHCEENPRLLKTPSSETRLG